MASIADNYIPAFRSAIARIFHPNGAVVGVGFLVSGRSQNYILTCAHVVTWALSLPQDIVETPTNDIYLDFPLIASGQKLKAKVVFWQPVVNNVSTSKPEDIAGLQIEGKLPHEAQPIKLISASNVWGHPFRIFGFPQGHNDGVWSTGVLRDGQGKRWVQLEDSKVTGYRIEPGFSGAPIWDETLAGVVGMAVAAEKQREGIKTAFMIPGDVLSEAWDEINLPISSNVQKDQLERQLQDKFEEIKKADSELSQLNQESLDQVDPDKIPFTNRDAPINEITGNNFPTYCLITAPKGYGKTEFLKQIQKRFQELQWCCAYASMSGDQNIEDLEKELASSLNLQIQEGHDLPWGEYLGLLLCSNWAKWQSQGQKKGIVLLIDLDGNAPQKQRLNEIFALKELGQIIEKCLRELQFFKDNARSIRVVIATRCLTDLSSDKIVPKLLILSPFTWEVIQDTATKYLKPIEMTSGSLSLLAGHLLYLTGGHPAGIAEALKVYRGGDYTVNLFLKSYGSKLWERNLRHCRDQIKESLTKENNHLYESIEKLSIFPILDGYWILKEAVRRFQLPFSDDSFKLNAELTKTSIFTREKTIIKDGMTRRLLVIGLLRETSPESFKELCSEAAQICWEYVHKLKSKNDSAVAGTWSMQYFFQTLQQHAGFINFGADSLAYRQELRRSFFDETVKETIGIFRNTDREQTHEFLSTLKSEVEHDWEFQFLVNYYLHNEEYNDKPYRDLIQKLDEAIQNN